MKIRPINGDPNTFAVTGLLDLVSEGEGKLQVGIATFPAGKRHPETGMTAHKQREISLILEGGFDVETMDGVTYTGAGDLIELDPGEAHATIARADSKVFYILFG